ncbi:MAG: hypothetical protein SFV51_23810 [Bryobacteraceae bacterium]|nr:hypothetical protein [Bryobacteraceae bacterium]
MKPTRREVLGAAALPAALAAQQAPGLEAVIAARHDKSVEHLLKLQVTDPASSERGGIPDANDLYHPGSASGLVDAFNAAFHHPMSKFHKSPLMLERLRLSMDYFARSLSPDGNIDNPITNFNSPADTAFAVQNLAMAANIARKRSTPEVLAAITPTLKKAAGGLAKGGIHTPNHRWVLCAALAQVNEVMPDTSYLRRIGQWLAEGIDIDEDGQYDERSIIGYNIITNRAFVLMAEKLKRPELLDPVRRNLDSALYLTHPGDEMVTEVSHRQDRNQRGLIGLYWFPMHYMAWRDRNPVFASIARKYAATHAGLSLLMEFPQLLEPLPQGEPIPSDYEKHFKAMDVIRIRRGLTSATIMLRGDSRFFMLRRGDAVISAVRFASAFFGKGQFIPRQWSRPAGGGYLLKHSLTGPYYQPLDPPHRVRAGEWNEMRPERARTEVCFLEQSATIAETPKGFRLRLQSYGTDKVPVAVEVNVRGKEKLVMDGLTAARDGADAFQLSSGQAVIRAGSDVIRLGPGLRRNAYTQVRGAEARMPGGAVYLTGYTPFDHTIEFECG